MTTRRPMVRKKQTDNMYFGDYRYILNWLKLHKVGHRVTSTVRNDSGEHGRRRAVDIVPSTYKDMLYVLSNYPGFVALDPTVYNHHLHITTYAKPIRKKEIDKNFVGLLTIDDVNDCLRNVYGVEAVE